MNIRRTALGAVLILTTGFLACTPDSPEGLGSEPSTSPNLAVQASVQTILEAAGSNELGGIEVLNGSLRLHHLRHDDWVSRRASDPEETRREVGWGGLPLDVVEFPLDWFQEAFGEAECGERSTDGKLSTTPTGLVVGTVGCRRGDETTMVASWLDGHAVAPLHEWGADALDGALHTAELVVGGDVTHITLEWGDALPSDPLVPAAPTLEVGVRGECGDWAEVGGSEVGYVDYKGWCVGARGSRLTEPPIELGDLSGARLMDLVLRASKDLDVHISDVKTLHIESYGGEANVTVVFSDAESSAEVRWNEALS